MIISPDSDNKPDKDVDSIELNFGYFKHGDNLAHLFSETKDVIQTLVAHAEDMRGYAKYCDDIIAYLKTVNHSTCEIDGGAHMVTFSGPEAICKALVEKDMAQRMEWMDEEEECDVSVEDHDEEDDEMDDVGDDEEDGDEDFLDDDEAIS